MSEIVEVTNYLAVDDRGNWSHHHGDTVMKYGNSLTSWEDYLGEINSLYGETPGHVLRWFSSTGLYFLQEWGTNRILAEGSRLAIHERPGNILGIEITE